MVVKIHGLHETDRACWWTRGCKNAGLDCWILLVRLEPRICRTVEVSWVPFTNSWFLRAASSSCVKTHVEPSFKVKSSPPRSSCNLYTNDSVISLFVDFLLEEGIWKCGQLHGVFHGNSLRSRSAKSIDVVATPTFVAEDKGEQVDWPLKTSGKPCCYSGSKPIKNTLHSGGGSSG